MKTALTLTASLALILGTLTACAPGTTGIPYCVDDALILPEGNQPRPRTSQAGPGRSRTSKPWSKPSKSKTTKHGRRTHYDDYDCD